MTLGIALGAAVKSGVGTYTALQDQAARDLQAQRMKRQMDDEDGFRKAQSEVNAQQYSGGSEVPAVVDQSLNFYDQQQKDGVKFALSKMTPEEQQTALRSFAPAGPDADLTKIGVYKGADGRVLATNEYKELSGADRQTEVAKRMVTEGNLYGVEKALGLKGLMRQNDLNDAFDKFKNQINDDLSLVQRTVSANGLSGVPDALKDRLKSQGLTAEFKDDKVGGMVLVKKGSDIVGQYRNGEDIAKALTSAQTDIFSQKMLPLFPDMQSMVGWMTSQYQLRQKDRELGLKASELGIKSSEAKSRGEYWAANTKKLTDGSFDMPLVNSVTGATLFYNKTTGAARGADGQPVTDLTGYTPVAMAQTRATIDAQADRSSFGKAEMKEVSITGEDGKPRKLPVMVAANRGKDGAIKLSVQDLTGNVITDPKILEQLAGGTGSTEDPMYTAAVQGLTKNLSEGRISAADYTAQLKDIDRHFGRSQTAQAFGNPEVKLRMDAAFGGGGGGGSGGSGNSNAANASSPPRSAIPVIDPKLPVAEQLKQAALADQKSGKTYYFTQLANEATKKVPLITTQLANIKKTMLGLPEKERQTMEAQRAQLEQDLQIYKSILQQQKSRSGTR